MQGEEDTNAGKGVTWFFSSTLQLVHVLTGKVIGAAVLLSGMAFPLHLHPGCGPLLGKDLGSEEKVGMVT